MIGSRSSANTRPRIMPQRESGLATFAPPITAADSIDENREARLAQPSDIAHAKHISKGAKRYWINHLCKYRNNSNKAWPKRSTAAADLLVTERSIKLYRKELLENDWICLPEGDAGGAKPAGQPKGLVIHLHPDGRPCHLPKISLTQRKEDDPTEINLLSMSRLVQIGGEESSPLNFPPEGEIFAPLRGKKMSPKGEENGIAIRKELLKEPLKQEPSTATAADFAAELIKPQTADDDGAGTIAVVKDFADPIFGDLEQMCDPPVPINGVGRARILRAAYKFAFNLQQLRYAWRRDARFQTGGLIMLAENWAAETAHLSFPTCLACEDTGTLALQQKLIFRARRGFNSHGATRDAFDRLISGSGLFCSCAIGVKAADAAAPAVSSPTAPTEESDQRASRLAEQRRRADEAASEKKRVEAERIADLVARHVCTQCAGARGRQQHGAWHLCLGCLGTGQQWTPEEHRERSECGSCRGTAKVHDSRQGYNFTSKKAPWMIECQKCAGSGKVSLVCSAIPVSSEIQSA